MHALLAMTAAALGLAAATVPTAGARPESPSCGTAYVVSADGSMSELSVPCALELTAEEPSALCRPEGEAD